MKTRPVVESVGGAVALWGQDLQVTVMLSPGDLSRLLEAACGAMKKVEPGTEAALLVLRKKLSKEIGRWNLAAHVPIAVAGARLEPVICDAGEAGKTWHTRDGREATPPERIAKRYPDI